ncbi:hypothetical protein KFK09_018611 [Dendrobium nobile]|uniref:Uncharacterized protein n=1 Tax=Dendrobium nobile TaxID=94219 RepID=A0A8T3AVQ6_DENNO|nr:hypothetical protein KFK09_018611 [Dendrobium nobile]
MLELNYELFCFMSFLVITTPHTLTKHSRCIALSTSNICSESFQLPPSVDMFLF